MTRWMWPTIVASVTLAGTTDHARADLVLERYTEARPANADLVLIPLRQLLLDRGIGAKPALVKSVLNHVPLPAITDPRVTSDALIDQFEIGWRSWIRGKYADAAVQLEAAVRVAFENPAIAALDPSARAALHRGLAGLALSRHRLGDTAGASAAMAELFRSVPLSEISALHPEVDKLYRDVAKALALVPRSTLIVVTRPDARIFVNELEVARAGRTSRPDMLPGDYRLLVKVGSQARRYEITIERGRDLRLEIDWSFESRLTVADNWVGLVVSAAERGRELEDARAFSKLGGNMSRVLVLGVEESSGRLVITGSRYRVAKGLLEWSGSVQVDRGDHAKLRAFARFLIGGERSPEILPLDVVRASRAPGRRTARRALWPAWLAGAGALAAAGAGSYLVYSNLGHGCAGPCTRAPWTAGAGWASIGIGAAAGGFALYWYLVYRSPPPASTIGVVPTSSGGIATVGWRF